MKGKKYDIFELKFFNIYKNDKLSEYKLNKLNLCPLLFIFKKLNIHSYTCFKN